MENEQREDLLAKASIDQYEAFISELLNTSDDFMDFITDLVTADADSFRKMMNILPDNNCYIVQQLIHTTLVKVILQDKERNLN